MLWVLSVLRCHALQQAVLGGCSRPPLAWTHVGTGGLLQVEILGVCANDVEVQVGATLIFAPIKTSIELPGGWDHMWRCDLFNNCRTLCISMQATL